MVIFIFYHNKTQNNINKVVTIVKLKQNFLSLTYCFAVRGIDNFRIINFPHLQILNLR